MKELKHIVCTAYVVKGEKIILMHHKKLSSWLPPGGHLEENELPEECAKRECKEETGIEIEVLDYNKDFSFTHDWTKTIPNPFAILLEKIEENHFHIDLSYLAVPVGGELNHLEKEAHSAKWFTLKEIGELKKGVVFENTKLMCSRAIKLMKERGV